MLTVLLLFPTLSFVTEGLLTQSTDRAVPSLDREAAKVKLRNQVYAIRFGSKSRFILPGKEKHNELARSGSILVSRIVVHDSAM